MAKKELNPDEVTELIDELNLELNELTGNDALLLINHYEEKGNIFFAGIAIYDEDRDKAITTIYSLTKHIKKQIQELKKQFLKIKL